MSHAPLVLLCLALGPQGSRFELLSPERTLPRAADADRSGDVGSEEWSEFLSSLEAADDGTLDEGRVLARLIAPLLDANGDGRFARDDVAAHLARLDVNGSGTVEASEMLGVIQGFRRGGGVGERASGGPGLLDGLIGFGVDANEDHVLDAGERAAAIGDGTSAVEPTELAAWVAHAERYVPEERSAFAPGTLTLTLRAALDATQDGRLTLSDLARHFNALDTDGSGSLSAAEIAAGTREQTSSTASVRTAEEAPSPDDERVPLVPWQRTLEDALALSRSSGKPLLLCVNMDNEPASDLLALGRYRDPAFVELVRGFVPVIASPDSHRPRERDGKNRRLPDPRFGRVVESEHVAVEPVLFERYFSGRRVAPRHVGVAPDGTILFDLFLLQDLRAVDRALEQHGKPGAPWQDVTKLDEEGLLASPDAAARERLEARFAQGDEIARARLLERALSDTRPVQHPELVIQGLRDPVPALRAKALEALAARPLDVPLETFPEALRVAAGFPGAVEHVAEALKLRRDRGPAGELVRARRLACIARASLVQPVAIDVELWRSLVGSSSAESAVAADDGGLFERLAVVEARAGRAPEDAELQAAHAHLALTAAQRMIAQGSGNPSFLLQDAESAARRAIERDPGHALGQAVLASAAYQLGDFAAAGDAAERALPRLVGWAETPLAASTLEVLAKSRTQQLYEVLGTETAWPATWMAELLAAQEVLLAHPLGTEAQALAALDVLTNLELYDAQAAFSKRALARWPLSATLHNWLRWIELRDGGPEALLTAYDDLDLGPGADATRRWYGGVAAIVAAERWVEDGFPDDALSAYRRAVGELESSGELEPSYGSTARYWIALARAGEARLCYERAELDQALEALRASVTAHEAALPADGLGHTRASTAGTLSRALERAGRSDEARELEPVARESAAASSSG